MGNLFPREHGPHRTKCLPGGFFFFSQQWKFPFHSACLRTQLRRWRQRGIDAEISQQWKIGAEISSWSPSLKRLTTKPSTHLFGGGLFMQDEELLQQFLINTQQRFESIMCLWDLEADYMNPYESSSRINAVVVPEFVLHGAFCAVFLVTGHWFMFLVTFPVACYNMMLFMNRQHLIDVTEVFRFLKAEKKHRMIKLGFYLIFFAIVILRLVLSVIKSIIDEDDAVHEFGIF
ncbi:hypothetical protein F0562_017159 [Nyssa sinensis]|uniref:Cornichon family protein n=1 Tax=Nyssa sinensis TaxID=561372 RepID=A0A5J4ZEG9_9ASTE|nr:hypothetical protein F0562_017159 [Nyssa sinensis]